MKCGYCKRLFPLEHPLKIGGLDACQSCGEKIIEVQIYDDTTLKETAHRVIVMRGKWRTAMYKSKRYRIFVGNGGKWAIQINSGSIHVGR